MTIANDLYYDPYDVEINADPYPVYRRLREESPLYYNEPHDFFAVSRYDDVEKVLVDKETYISSKGGILELIRAGIEFPSGVLIFEDPPIHTSHRGLLSRVFTPKKMAALEPQIRAFCARSLDPLVGAKEFDFIADLGAQMPMRVIGMLLGVPESDQESFRDLSDTRLRTEAGQAMTLSLDNFDGSAFGDYIDWRAENPSDDVMTELMNAEFEDEEGVRRTLTRDEVLTYLNVVAGAGNETTGRLIGWMGKTLGDHPDQRRELVEDRSLVPNAVEEVLRFEPPGVQIARYMTKDAEFYGTTIPAGSVMVGIVASANRDNRKHPDGDRFDIHRKIGQQLTFGYGVHFCLGAALARMEGRIALDEILQRFPEWELDMENARLSPTSTVRGWETLPARIP